ncbi:RHS repeat-associated core domain-containing protein [Sorangium sp. So ce1335]
MGKVAGVRGPDGEVSLQRDVMGRPIAALVGDEREPLRLAYDARGFEIERLLPGGGRIATEVNAERLLARQSVLGKPATPRVGPGEPPWVGPLVAPETWRRTYAWSPAGLLRADDDRGGTMRGELLRDANGRVIERRRAGKAAERFRFTAAGDLERAGEQRTYAPGGRLTARAAGRETVRYDHSERGDVVSKRVTGSDAAGEQARERVWAYAWSGDGRLMEARTPEGCAIAFAYDAFGRRIEKRVARLGALESVTRYAWRGDALVHERRERADAAGARVVEERSYVTLPESALPLAQRDGAAGALRYFVHGVNGLPEALVEGDGSVAAELEAGLYGDVPAEQARHTPLRFPGQYADEETGLHYNGHRYYDPETGAYLSPEPIGLEGSLKAYAYADAWLPETIDLDGLKKDPVVCTIRRKDGTVVTGSSQDRSPNDLHKAVLAALPPTPARDPDDPTAPWNCAEPAALSAHIRDWEERNKPKKCDPGTKGWKKNLRSAMREIDEENGISSKHEKSDVARAACPNCSQTVPRLFALAGMMPPTKVLAPGYQNRRGVGPVERFSQPNEGFHKNPSNKSPNAPVPGTDNLGTWSLTNKGWRRYS